MKLGAVIITDGMPIYSAAMQTPRFFWGAESAPAVGLDLLSALAPQLSQETNKATTMAVTRHSQLENLMFWLLPKSTALGRAQTSLPSALYGKVINPSDKFAAELKELGILK